MSRRAATLLAWGLWTVDIAVIAALVPLSSAGAGVWGHIGGTVFITVFASTGALVASRHPANPIGWLLCLAAFAFTVGGVCVWVSEYAARENIDGPAVTAAAWIGTFVWMLGIGPAATFLLLLFPDGRLPSHRWRAIAWLAGASLAATLVALALAPGPIEDTRVINPVGATPWAPGLRTLENAGLTLLFASILASCASLVVRYRTAGLEQRQQLKWLAWSLPMVLLWLGASIWVESTQQGETAADIGNALASIGLTVVPVAITVAMLRHRLYDIDVVINRTLVYGSLTATLAAVYLGSVLLLQLLLNPLRTESDLAVAVSTLAVAALFGPARARIQAGVDRRFYRSRYDATRTLEAFAGRLRHEVDLDAVGADLRAAASDTVQPAHLSLWLRGAP